MTSFRYGLVLREVGRLLGGGSASTLGAGPLLERFAADRDAAAFEALVSRHGPMVLGTCRRMLSDPHDVDDAFQATFLVLARKAGSIQDADRLGPWLHGVARRVAARSRALSSRRKAVERQAVEEPAAESPDLLEGSDLREALDEELARLPEKYRAPLVLCYLEGLTHDEAAEHLRWPVGTVRSRLAGGRDRLRTRLTRRGLSPSAAVPALLPTGALPSALLSTTVRVATAAGSPSAHVLTLAKGALIAMTWNKLKMVAALGLMAGLTVGGAGVAAQKGEAGKAEARVEETPLTAAQFEAEIRKIRAEESAILKKIRDLEAEQKEELKPLLKAAADISNREFDVSQRWKKWEKETASTAIDDRMKQLEKQVTDQAAVIQALQEKAKWPAYRPLEKREKVADPRSGVTTPPVEPPGVTKSAAPANNPAPPPAEQPPPEATVMTLPGNPTLFAVISTDRDRVTMINSVTQKRSTFRLSHPATEISPFATPQWVALRIKGPQIGRTAVFDRAAGRWIEHDLRGTATEVLPWMGSHSMTMGDHPLLGFTETTPDIRRLIVFDGSNGTWAERELLEPARDRLKWAPTVNDVLAIYNVGRYIYIYNSPAKKWSVLERKQDSTSPASFPGQPIDATGRLIFAEGDLIHLYDIKAGEWTHIDTKDEGPK